MSVAVLFVINVDKIMTNCLVWQDLLIFSFTTDSFI